MKTKRFFLYVFALIASITNLWAGLPAFGTTKTGTPENGKKYYIYADTYSGGAYVNRYLYNNNGTLKMNAAVDESSDFYVWTCTVSDGKYTFQNVGDNTKYLAHKALANAAYNFTLGKANATHEGTTIWSDGASRYLVAKNDGSTFDQATNTYNQTSGDWCTDYVFVEYVVPTGNTLDVTANYTGAGTLKVNGKTATFPYKKWQNTATLPATFTVETGSPYTFVGFFNGEENLGTEYTVESIKEASVAIEARFTLDIFSTSLNSPVPVRINNNRDKSYSVKMNAAASYSGNAINSGTGTYGENEIWYLVGNAESFKMYSRTAGTDLALTLAGTNAGAAATLTTTGTNLCLASQTDGSFAICPVSNTAQSLNMHGGAGQDIKLYNTTDGGSKWLIKKVDTTKPLKINYNAQTTGGYEQNYKIGELAINVDGTTSTTMLEKSAIPASSATMYLPEGATFGISTGFMCHGWTMDINGDASINNQTLPAGGLTVNVNIAVDTDNKYQYLYYSPGPNGKPYRIPAITTTANGYVFAINDYRPCGNDIGFGEVDLVMRHSTAAGSEWDGHSWTESVTIADGLGHTNDGIWKLGFGDPAIVADRESNQVLVMSVCGNRTCWNGNYGAGTDENPENPNRVSRLYITFNESTQQWEVGEPEEVTYSIYPLFDDEEGNHHVGSLFIGAGRIAQSSKIKVGTHYRIYCAVWAVATGSGRYHNYAIYSDNFGKTWNLLGELGNDYNDSPAPYGNEPKCEELPDGSVLLSSRKGYGRYFNVFHYTDIEKGEGTWDGVVATDAVGDLKWGSNDTNGEPLRVGNVLFQSAPTGSDRSDVSIFYKVLSDDAADNTPTKLSNGWTKIEISDEYSAYSSMALLPDGETLAIYYEEAPGGYSMVYLPLKLKDILPADVYEALSATQTNKSALKTLIAETEELINDCYDYYATEVALQTTQGEDYYIWCNAPQSGDEGNVGNLLDGQGGTFFHSNWQSTTAPADGLDHHLTVELGENNAVSEFRFHYQARSGGGLGDYPKTIKVQGSNDGVNYNDIAIVEPRNENGGVIENGAEWTSEILGDGNSYTYLRFMVTATTTNKDKDGHIFFHMAEFDLMPRTAEPANNYPNAVNVPAATAKATTAVTTAKEALTATQSVAEYESTLKALQTAYDELVAAIASGTLPVLVTTNANNPIVYKIGSKRGDTKVLYYDLATTNMFGIADDAEGSQNQAWYFTKASEGKVYIHPYLGGGDVIAAKSTSNSPAATWAAPIGTENHDEWQIIQVNAENGTYNIKAGDNSNYFSNNGGTSNKMGFWSNDNTTDTGSLFTFTRIDFDGGIWYNTLDAYIDNVCTVETYTEGTKIGEPQNTAAYNETRPKAISVLNNEGSTETNYKNAYTALRAAKESITKVAPTAGKYYTINQDGKYITSTVANGRIACNSTNDATAIYYFDGSHLLAYSTGLYFGLNGTDWTFEAVGSTEISEIEFVTAVNGAANKFNIKSGGRWLHLSTDNGIYYVNRCSNNTCGDAHNWTIQDVEALPVTISDAGYASFYAPVALEVPENVTANTVTINGEWATLTEIEDGVIPANTGVILAGEEGAYDFAITSTDATVEDNTLLGTVAKTEITDNSKKYYILANGNNGIGLYPHGTEEHGNFVNNSHKAYLAVGNGAGALSYGFTFGGTTGIEGVEAVAGEKAIYDLTGRKIEAITAPGLYIINGVKTFVE